MFCIRVNQSSFCAPLLQRGKKFQGFRWALSIEEVVMEADCRWDVGRSIPSSRSSLVGAGLGFQVGSGMELLQQAGCRGGRLGLELEEGLEGGRMELGGVVMMAAACCQHSQPAPSCVPPASYLGFQVSLPIKRRAEGSRALMPSYSPFFQPF